MPMISSFARCFRGRLMLSRYAIFALRTLPRYTSATQRFRVRARMRCALRGDMRAQCACCAHTLYESLLRCRATYYVTSAMVIADTEPYMLP